MQNRNVLYVALIWAAHCTKAQSILSPFLCFFFFCMQLMLSNAITTPDFKPRGRISLLYVQTTYQRTFISWIVFVFFMAPPSSPRTHAVRTKRSLTWTRQQACVTWFVRKLRSARPSLCSPCLCGLFRLAAFPRFSSKLEDSSFKWPHACAHVPLLPQEPRPLSSRS